MTTSFEPADTPPADAHRNVAANAFANPTTAARASTRRNDERTIAGAHRRMRRADREVTEPERIREIIAASPIVSVAYADAEGLTLVPMDFGYEWVPKPAQPFAATPAADGDGLTLYMHSSPIGRKADALRAAGEEGLPVSFDMIADGSRTIPGRTLCNWGRAYASIVGTGIAHIVTDMEEAAHGLQLLMAHEAGMVDASGMPSVSFTEQQARSVMVWRIDVTCYTAKSRPVPPATVHHAVHREAREEY